MITKLEHELLFSDIKPSTINSSFDEAVVRIACLGDNRNGSSFSKQSFDKALPSLKNIPIVALYKEEERNFGGHETSYEIEDGDFKVVYNTHPFGVVHESAKQWYETVQENGVEKTYLVSECLLWKRQKSYDLVKEKGRFAVSMEIEVKKGNFDRETAIYKISDFIFTAIAVLGEGVEPCFKSAEIKLFSENKEYMDMLQEYKNFSLEAFKGGETMEDMNNVVESVIVTEVEETVEVEETQVEEVEETKEVEVEETETEEVETTKEESNEENEDNIAEEKQVTEEEVVDYEAKYNELQVEYGKLVSKMEGVKSEMEEMKEEFSRLKKFEENVLLQERTQKEGEVFSKFSMIEDTEEFKELKAKANQYSLEELENMCYTIVGRIAFSKKDTKTKAPKNTNTKLSFGLENKENKTIYYGGILG